MDLSTLHAFEAEIKKHVPTFKVSFKNETPWMKALGFLMSPINPNFMTSYTTRFGSTVYFPSRATYESQPKPSFTMLAHEFVHLRDVSRYPGWFQLSYAFPQVLAPVPLLAYAVGVPLGWAPVATLILGYLMGCWAARKSWAFFYLLFMATFATATAIGIALTHWWSALFLIGSALLTPLPSVWRTKWELRGYTMNLAIMAWTYGPPPVIVRDMVGQHFYGHDYFYMSWSRADITTSLNAAITRAQSGSLRTEDPYGIVYDFLASRKELRVSDA